MAETFEDLGIAAGLIAGAESVGWAAPTALQEAATPVIRRGNNVVLHASTGAGVVGGYGLGILDRVATGDDADGAPRALVLTPDLEAASRTATTLALLARPAGVTVRALAPGWPERETQVLVASPEAAMEAVRGSDLKLDNLLAVVVEAANRIAATGDWAALETILASAPARAQRVLVTGAFDDRMDDLAERHVRKAMTIPPRLAEGEAEAAGPTIRYAIAPEREKPTAAYHVLAGGAADGGDGGGTAVVCRSPDRAEQVESELSARGIDVGGDVLVFPWLEADQRSSRAAVLSYDVPFDADGLAALHARGGAVVVTPAEMAHLRRMAARIGARLEAVRVPMAAGADQAGAFRDRLRTLIKDGDLAADLALLEPLFDEFPAPVIAAAAAHLARSGAAARPGAAAAGATQRRDRSAAAATAPAAAAPPPETTWVRLFVTAGTRDGIGPGDLVGAITGETSLDGEAVGKIDVRESHSTVEVPGESAEAVIAALNGRSLRGRSLRVDYDRKERDRPAPGDRSRGPQRKGPPRGGPPKGGAPRGGPSRGGPSRGGPSRGGPSRGGPSRGGPSRGGSSRGGPPRGGPSRGPGPRGGSGG